tara:strand:+ start:740 stop:1279 length:540 start_codon:yes stop_codon:yes gene_type:complete
MTDSVENRLSENQQRVRDYLVTQAEQRDWIELWPRTIVERGMILQLIDRMSDTQADWAPSDEEWSTRQIIEHLLAWSRETLQLVEDLAAGRPEDMREQPPETKAPISFSRLRKHLAEHSVKLASLPERLPPMVNLDLTSPQGNFGELNSRSWFLFIRVHDTDHRQQIEAIIAADGYPEA